MSEPPDPSTRRAERWVVAAVALAAYIPMLLTAPGRVSADTKSYLTLDPGRLLARATTMWDPLTGAGTVPHQNIGYLFPLGPYYWLMDQLSVPDWITQRLVWGTLVFAATMGAYRLARWLGWSLAGGVVVGVAYGFSPYVLSYLARLSVILGPWAAMPWLILLTARAARTRSWRPAACFALVVALVGSVNATALVLAGLGPVVWLVVDVVAGRVRPSMAVAAAARIGVLTIAVSVWWIVALRVQGTYGLPILRYTETYQTVAGASTPAEIVRSLGYWFFYGGDRLDQWVGPSLTYIDTPAVIAFGFAIAGVALLGLLSTFAGRSATLALLFVGLVVSVGAAPLGHSSLYGMAFEWLATNSTAGMALRSTPRAAPLVLLALAFGLGAAAEWVGRRVRSVPAAAVIAVVVVAVQLGPWFTASVTTPSLLRDEALPAYQRELATWLDSSADGLDGRVYEMPAADFAYYRWGGTVDPVLPGIIDRPYLARELVPQGSMATIDLLDAIERRIPEGWFEPEGLRDLATLFGVQTLVVRNDLQHERLRLARPGQLWTDLTGALGDPGHAGPTVVDTPEIPVLDELTLAHPDAATEFPVVAAFEIGAGGVVRTAAATSPIIVAGSGDGLVDMAGAGLLDPQRPVLYAATLDDLAARDELPTGALGTSPWWVLTDTNRREARHWSSVSANRGALEPDGEIRLDPDPADSRLDVFAPAPGQQTNAVHLADVTAVRASYYGNRIAFTPEDAPWFAIDGDPTTAWRAGVFDRSQGLVWEAEFDDPVAPGTITLLQPITGVVDRYLTAVDVTLDGPDGATTLHVALDERSRAEPGQTIDVGRASFSAIRIKVVADNLGPLANYAARPGIGLAEVVVPGVTDDRVTRVPGLSDFASLPHDDVADDRLTYVLTRQRIDPATPNRTAPEPALARQIEVPVARSFALTGEARLAADAGESILAEWLGDRDPAIADRRLPGVVAARGHSAFDTDPTTAWQTPFGDQTAATITLPAHLGERDIGTLTVSWLDDGQHSPPRALSVQHPDGSVQIVDLGLVAPVDGIATTTVQLDVVAPVNSLTITEITPVTSPEYFSGADQVLPVGIVDIVVDPVVGAGTPVPAPSELTGDCRADLVSIDGQPVAVRITGTREDALARAELLVEACAPVELASGQHRIDVAAGASTGIDLDRLVLDAPAATTAGGGAAPQVTTHASGSTRVEVAIAESAEPAWLILRQSWNPGWHATLDGTDIGTPVLIDGYANGWLLPAAATAQTVILEWTPQTTVTIALWVSLLATVAVAALAVFARRDHVAGDDTIEPVPIVGTEMLAIALTIVLALVAGPVVAVASVLIAAMAQRRRSLAVAVVVCAGAVVAGGIVALEWRRDLPADPQWPSQFAWTAPLVWWVVGVIVCTGALGARRN